MPTEVRFDNAVIFDAIQKASRVAPTKGDAFDKAAGILFIIDPQRNFCQIRATNLDVSFETTIPTLVNQGDAATWRLPSGFLSNFMASLPTGPEDYCEFIDRMSDGFLRLVSGRTVLKVAMLDADLYPSGNAFEWTDGEFADARNLQYKVEQVSWACDPKSPTLGGVHVDGKSLIGGSTSAIAIVEADVALDEPVTVPLHTLSQLLKTSAECKIRAGEKKVFLSLDSKSRSTSLILANKYPDVSNLERDTWTVEVKCHKPTFLDSLTKLLTIAKEDKIPILELRLEADGLIPMMVFDMSVPGVGRMRDSFDVETDYDGPAESIFFNPNTMRDAVQHAKGDYVTFRYGHADPLKFAKTNFLILDDRGYKCFVMPRNSTKEAVDKNNKTKKENPE